MNLMRGWNAEKKAELDAAFIEAWNSGDRSTERANALLGIVEDAAQEHRQWARDVQRQALRAGLASMLKRWKKARDTIQVSVEGRVLNKTATVGVTGKSDAGDVWHQQVLLHDMSRDDLTGKRSEYLAQVRSYTDNVEVVDKLLALLDAVGHADTPREAAAELGTTVEAWLAGDEAA